MAVRSIVSIDINDAKFREFQRLYEKYDKALKSAPAAWKMVQDNIDGSRESFDKLVEGMAAANVQAKLREKAQETADRLTRTTAERWQSLARNTREFAHNIRESTISLLKWSSIGGLIGVGSMWGLERLAGSVMQRARIAAGLGTTVGGVAAFGVGMQRLLENPQGFLAATAAAKYDINQRLGLITAGLTPGQIRGDTTHTALALAQALRREALQWDPSMYAQMLQAYQQQGLTSPEQLAVFREMTPDRFRKFLDMVERYSKELELPKNVRESWEDLKIKVDFAAKSIENTFITGLVPLTPQLEQLSRATKDLVSAFLKSPMFKDAIVGLTNALRGLTDIIQAPGANMGKVVAAVSGAWIGYRMGGPPGAAVGAIVGLGMAEGAGTMPIESMSKPAVMTRNGATYYSGTVTLGHPRFFGGGDAGNIPAGASDGTMTFDQLVNLVRKREGSGASAVSRRGAIGNFQIMPATGAGYGVSQAQLFDPAMNEWVARRLLADLARQYHGNVAQILAAYNTTTSRAQRYATTGDPNVLLPETQKYIRGTQGLHVTLETVPGSSVMIGAVQVKAPN